ncbi:P-type conjugative transfer ATPase TrbB [Xanthomonas campestris pv. campestris]|uniref:P-type conjugative transfer ATPase TrbB n=1 Tax=Xanthomonas campestris TaxID=339 RepID=UPI001E5EE323|nr:P-type conjugative transfer ATPase TrbB [Xanthomonas campestris]MCD0253094.1 P-type conjugative transfer ATPase TrbB [Xanthomonas campestris pv. campestris]
MADNDANRDRLLKRLQIDAGRFFMDQLANPKVIEIMRNADGHLWLDVAGKGMIDSGEVMSNTEAMSLLETTAGLLDTTVTKDRPILGGEFPLDNSRLLAVMPPVAESPIFALRKKASFVFPLEEYAQKGMLRPGTNKRAQRGEFDYLAGSTPLEALRTAVRSKANILVVGGTGSGKTTLANAVNDAIAKECRDDRVLVIEDTRELQMSVPNHLMLRSNDVTSMQDLLKAAMRLRPDRIIVGEVRGGEAHTLLKAWNSGHPGGVATIHADSAAEGLAKLATYCCENPNAQTSTEERMSQTVASVVQVVLFIERIGDEPGRAVSEICRVRGYRNGSFDLQSLSFD